MLNAGDAVAAEPEPETAPAARKSQAQEWLEAGGADDEDEDDDGLAEGSLCERRSQRQMSYKELDVTGACGEDEDSDDGLAEGSLTQRGQMTYTQMEAVYTDAHNPACSENKETPHEKV